MNTELLLLVTIPLVAATIGYFTNWVAIWMLFRPHTEKRLLGVRIPFTPGLIPGRRLEMAERMGRAVAQHLITEEAVSSRLSSPGVRAKIEEVISGYLDELLEREWGPIETLIPEEFQGEWQKAIKALKGRLHSELEAILHDPQTEALISEQIDSRLKIWLTQPLGEVVPKELLEKIPDQLEGWLERLTGDEALEGRIRAFLDEKIDSLLREDKPLGAYVPARLKEAAYEKMEELMPLMIEKLASVLEDEKLKKRIKVELYELIDKLLSETFKEDSLWDQLKFSLMELFVISTDEIKLKIDRSIDEAAPRLAELLKQKEVQRRVNRALTDSVDTFLEKRPSDFKLDPGVLDELKERISRAVVAAARSPRLREGILNLVRARLDEAQGRSLQDLFPQLSSDQLSQPLSRSLTSWLRDEATVEALSEFVSRRIDELLARPIGRLRDQIPKNYVIKGKYWASERVSELLKRQTPKMVQAIDVEKLVREKVNELPISEVERLILAITSRQLRAITWFGALLGFLIGLIQVVIVLARGGL